MKDDVFFLRLAKKEGNKNPESYNFGAVVVKDGVIIARDHNRVHDKFDPSAHAEISALRKAGKYLKNYNLDGCILYCSHEPCVMCFCCAAWAKISRIVYALPASNINSDSYEFKGLSLEDLNQKLSRQIQIEHVAIK